MYIKCWGSRGSIPVSGKEFLKYGGETTCLEIRTKTDDIIIVDAGTGVRRLGNQLIREKRTSYNFIFTHAHWDHLMGFPFFRPIYMTGAKLRIFRCPFPDKHVEKMIARVMAPPYFPIKYSEIRAGISYKNGCPKKFKIGSMTIVPIPLSHPGGGCGYKFIEDGKTFVFLTDNELGFKHKGGLEFDDYTDFATGADLLFHDAEFTPEEYEASIEWGHSAYTDAIDLAIKANVKQLGLFHLNQERSDKEMDKIVTDCRKIISSQKEGLKCFAVGADSAFKL